MPNKMQGSTSSRPVKSTVKESGNAERNRSTPSHSSNGTFMSAAKVKRSSKEVS